MSHYPSEIYTLAKTLRFALMRADYAPHCTCASCTIWRETAQQLDAIENIINKEMHNELRKELQP